MNLGVNTQTQEISRKIEIYLFNEDLPLFKNPIKDKFAVLFPVLKPEIEDEKIIWFSKKMIDFGCIEFCIVGLDSERIHDLIDDVIVEKEMLDIVTTWHDVLDEACDYFLNCAGGGTCHLIAFARDSTQFQILTTTLLQSS